jgi:hypothetical protein
MKVDKKGLERTFDRFDTFEPAYDRLLDRRRRHRRRERIQAGIVALIVMGALGALIAGPLARRPQPVFEPAPSDRRTPSWTAAQIGETLVVNPGGWHLTGYFKGDIRDVVLATFAPDLSSGDPCAGMPPGGAIIRIHVGGPGGPATPPPLELGEPSKLACGGDQLRSAWSALGEDYQAVATFGPEASTATRSDLQRAYSALSFASPSNWRAPYCAYRESFAGEVLGSSGTTDLTSWTLYEMSSSSCLGGGGFWLSSAQGGGESAWWSAELPTDALDVHDLKFGSDSIVFGSVPTAVAEVRLETMGGRTIAADLIAGSQSNAYVAVLDNLALGTLTTFDTAGAHLDSARFTAGMQCQYAPPGCAASIGPADAIATGVDGSNWTLLARDASIDVVDPDGSVIASLPTGSPGIETAPLAASSDGLVFGVAPSGTALALREIPRVGWGLANIARLSDGTIVFWAPSRDTLSITVADTRCNPVRAFDPAGGLAVPADQHACLGSNGGD